jgi:hypothetical protein
MKPLVSMRAALGDDELLGKALPGPSWASWRVLLVAIMGEPLLDEERAIFAELTGGRERERWPEVWQDAGCGDAGDLSGDAGRSQRPFGSGRACGAPDPVGDAMASDATFSSGQGHLRWRACVGVADRERDGGHAAAADIG